MDPPSQSNRSGNPTAVLAIIVASYLMVVIDISIVITGLPKIQEGLGFTPAGLSWVQNAYTLAFGGFLLLGARAGDILGRRRMFIGGLGLFTLASLAIGLAPSAQWLLASRAIQGIGAAILTPSTLALLATHFKEGPDRTRALAYYAAAAGVGASVGLVLGGLVADLVSWRLGFFINVPIGVALMLGAGRFIAETPKRTGAFDLSGAITSTLGMSALVYGIVRSADAGWGDPVTLAALGAGVVLLGLFAFKQSRATQPLLPLRLFASRERSGAYAARLLFLGGMVGFWFFTTQYLQGVLGYRPLQAGLAFLPTTIPNFASAMLVPRLTRRFGNARLLAAGLAIGIVGMLWLGQVSAETNYFAGVALPMVLVGIGQGGVLGPLTVSAVAGVGGEDAGAASGLVNVAHQLGSSLGLGILVVVFAVAGAAGAASPAELAHRVAATFHASAVMLAMALGLVLAFIVGAKGAQSGGRLMTRVLIIGANGQLARHTTPFLLAKPGVELTLFLRRAARLRNPDPSRVSVVEGDATDRKALQAAMQGQDVVYANLSGNMEQQAKAIVAAMHAAGLKRLIFISSMGIYGEVPGERYRSVLDPYRDSAAVIEASALDYTILRPGWFTREQKVDYRITQKGEPFQGHDVTLDSLADLIVKLATTPGLESRRSIGVSTP